VRNDLQGGPLSLTWVSWQKESPRNLWRSCCCGLAFGLLASAKFFDLARSKMALVFKAPRLRLRASASMKLAFCVRSSVYINIFILLRERTTSDLLLRPGLASYSPGTGELIHTCG
jgi:hypothetical protein